MKTARGILLFSALGLFVSAVSLDAATYLPLSDQDLAHRSPVIVRAVVQGSALRVESADGKNLPFTITALQPIEWLKGSIGDGPLQVRLPGGRVGDQAWWIPGTPVFKNGQEVLVFLEPRAGHPGEYHLSEFGLGHFDILTDREGRRFAVRPAFEPTEDLYLGTLGPEPGTLSPERAVLRRDAESLLAMVRSQTRRADPEVVLVAAPSGDLSKGPLELRPEWVNIGGVENGTNNLFRWFWDTSASPNAVVSVNGTQTLLSDSSNGLVHVQNGIDQWHGGVPSTDIRISGITGGGNITVFLDAITPFTGTAWSDALVCGTGGVIGLGGPGATGPSRTFKGDSNYFPTVSGHVSMRTVTSVGASPGCMYNAPTFRTAVMHELGHVLGLGHPDNGGTSTHSTTPSSSWTTAVMTSSVPGSRPSTPQVDDAQAMQYYYGTAGPVPTAAFSFAPPSPTVSQTVTFTDASTGSPATTSWSWNFGDSTTSTQQSPMHAFTASGTFNVSLTASNTNGPSTPVTHQVVVSGRPTANFNFSPALPTTGQTVSFTDTSTGTPAPTTYFWNFGDSTTSTLKNPTHVFASAGTYNVSHTATNTNGTSTPLAKPVVVSVPSPPTAHFNFSPFSPVTGQSVFFTDTSTGSPVPTSWVWSFGDPASGGANTSTLQNPTHAFASAGTHTVILTATNTAGPSAPASQQITVSTPGVAPMAAFVFSPGTPVPGQSVNFTDTSTGGPTSWFWSFGDAFSSFSTNPSHAYSVAGTYTVSLTATNNFGSAQVIHTVTVSSMAVPSASFTFSPSAPQPTQSVSFTDTSSGTPTAWTWDFGDGASSSLRNPSHTYIGAGNYTVSLTASNLAGPNQASQTVSVHVPTPCSSDPGTLPANAGHNFCITLSARDQRTGRVGPGLAIPRNNLFGYFSIPALTSNPDNPEVFVKVLDGRVVNGFFWVFYGGMTDLEYTLTVRDFQTGVTRQYLKPAGSADGGFDTLAFSPGSSTVDPPSGAATAGSVAAQVSAGCTGDAGTLCLNASHSFFVSLTARDQRTERTGVGQAIPVNDIFGYFSITALTSNPDNPEVFVKVLDGRAVNGFFWVFYGGLTDLEYTITVREVSTGRVRTFFKPAGSASGGFDTLAF